MNNLEHFRQEFLNANTWAQRKDGVPLYLLDKLSEQELKIAEAEMIAAANVGDTWHIEGLGHIKSKAALPKLYELLPQSAKGVKISVAHSIFQICGDSEMIEVALEEMPTMKEWYELIDALYLLPDFKDERVIKMLHQYRNHHHHLVAYNAIRALGLNTA